MSWQIEAGLRTSPAPGKPANEDTAAVGGLILTADRGAGIGVELPAGAPVVALVADGMGGHVAGREASRLAVDRLVVDPRLLRPEGDAISQALLDTHDALYAAMHRDATLAGMGTTVVGISIPSSGNATAFNVGDSRLLVKDLDLGVVQFSVDDAERVGTGTGSELTQCLGGTTERVQLAPHTVALELKAGDRLLLCSDGLTDVLSATMIASELAAGRRGAEVAHTLVEQARAEGAEDDVTVIVMDISEPS